MAYSAKLYDVPKEFIDEVSTLRTRRTVIAVALIWLEIVAITLAARWIFPAPLFWWLYIPMGFLIAGRQGALLQIVHEGSHSLISRNRRINTLVGHWFAALPVGLTLDGYTQGHVRHHANTNTENDLPTDRAKYSVTDLRSPKLYQLFLQDAFGITALLSFFGHNHKSIQSSRLSEQTKRWSAINKIASLAVVQTVLLGVVFQFDIVSYILLWAFPLVSFNMVLLRVRGITEHGQPSQYELEISGPTEGNRFTRSVVHPRNGKSRISNALTHVVERYLIGSLSANYHHEHHLFPRVPFYNLSRVHEKIKDDVVKHNAGVYVPSYHGAFLLGLRKQKLS